MRFLVIGILVYWIFKRIFKVADAVKRDGQPISNKPPVKPKSKSNIDHSNGGEYVDFEEIE